MMLWDKTMVWPELRWRALPLLVLLAAAGCSDEAAVPVVSPDLAEVDADAVIYGMTNQLTVEGVREAIVKADTAFVYEDSSMVVLRGLELTIFTETGTERAVVTARRGRLNNTTREMTAWGDVVLVIPEADRTIRTEELNYDPNRDRIWSDSTTIMEEGDRVYEGTAFESDLEFRDVRVRNARTRGGGGKPSP